MVNQQLLKFFCCKYCACNFADFGTYKNHTFSHEVIYRKFWLMRGQGLVCKCGYVVQGSGLRTHNGCHFWNTARRARSKYFAYTHQHPQIITSLYRRRIFKSKPLQCTPIKYEVAHSLPQHECPHCSHGFRKLENLKNHMKVHTGDTNYKCKECNRHFVSKTGLEYHRISKHTKNKPFKCDLCGHEFIKYQHMERHKRTHLLEKPFKCKICSRSYITNSNLKVHERTHLGIKQFHCKYCGRGFFQKGHMKDHMLGHGYPEKFAKPHVCDVCDKTFLRKKNLRDHYRTHTGEKPYSCSLCGHNFATNGLMMRHMKGHSGQLRYKCNQCEQGFTSSGNLRRHVMRNHTGVRPYKCELCNKGFAFIADLRTHELCHLPDSEKRLKCKICNRGFSVQSKLNVHVKAHSGERPYECEYEGCDKSFATASRRTRHHYTHSGVKNYKCPECSKAFSQPGNLKRHIRNHGGLTPYKCIFCDYRSAEKGNLKRHVKYKHPPEFTEDNLAIMLEPVFEEPSAEKALDSSYSKNDGMEDEDMCSNSNPPDIQTNSTSDDPVVVETVTNSLSKVLPPLHAMVEEQNSIIRAFVVGSPSPVSSEGRCLSNELTPLYEGAQNDDIPCSSLTPGNAPGLEMANEDKSVDLPACNHADVSSESEVVNPNPSLFDVRVEDDISDSNDTHSSSESTGINPDLPSLPAPHVSQNLTDITLNRNAFPTASDNARTEKTLPALSLHLPTNYANSQGISDDDCVINEHSLLSDHEQDNSDGITCSVASMLPIVSENTPLGITKSPSGHVRDDNSNIIIGVSSEGTRVGKDTPLVYDSEEKSSSLVTLKKTSLITMVRWPSMLASDTAGISYDTGVPSQSDDTEVIVANVPSSVVTAGACARKSTRLRGKGESPPPDVNLHDKINAIITRNTAVLESAGISKKTSIIL